MSFVIVDRVVLSRILNFLLQGLFWVMILEDMKLSSLINVALSIYYPFSDHISEPMLYDEISIYPWK